MSKHSFLVELEKSDVLSLKQTAGIAALVCGVIALVVGVVVIYNQRRAERIIAQYDRETQQWVDQNPDAVKHLFTTTFAECIVVAKNAEAHRKTYSPFVSDGICPAAREQLSVSRLSGVKNAEWSLYIKSDNSAIIALTPAGKYFDRTFLSSYDDSSVDLVEYLRQQKKINRLQDFTHQLPDKQIISPVIVDGTTVGYVLRTFSDE